MIKTLSEADAIHGGLSKPSKMPGYAYGIPAKRCKVGKVLHEIPESVCRDCYALKGRYSFKNVQDAQERRFQLLYSQPLWSEAIAFSINKRNCTFFRWHDSGDIQDLWHLKQIVDVVNRCPNTKFWLPTREQAVVMDYLRSVGPFPSNLVVRMSGAMVDGDAPSHFQNTSTVVKLKDMATCPAYTQGGVCGTCRQCWDPSVKNVSYPKH